MTNHPVHIVEVDPLDPVRGLLFPFVAQRVLAFAREQHVEMDPTHVTRELLARVVQGQPTIKLIALVDGASKVLGHVLASIETDGHERWCYIFQLKADGNVGEAVRKAVEAIGTEWCAAHGVTKVIMSTGRDERGWERAYGFKPLRHIMWKPLKDVKEAAS